MAQLKSNPGQQSSTGQVPQEDIELPEDNTPDTPRSAQLQAAMGTLWHAIQGATITAGHRASELFERLAEKGAEYQRSRARTNRDHSSSGQSATHSAEPGDQGASRPSAVERIHTLEHTLEDRLDKGRDSTLHWIGVPSNKAFEALETRVEILAQAVESLQRQRQIQTPDPEVPKHI